MQNDGCFYCQDADAMTSYLFVYRRDSQNSGISLVFDEGKSLYISYQLTSPTHLNQGICRYLLDRIKTFGPHGRITLQADSLALMEMYKKFGFQAEEGRNFIRSMYLPASIH
jgi:hypothetical protein